MSGSGGAVSMTRARGENRFYVSPGIRKQQQEKLLQQQQHQKQQKQQALPQKPAAVPKDCAVEIDQCGSNCSVSGRSRAESYSTNLDRFLEYTTPLVPAQFLPKTSVRGWRNREPNFHPYFVLGDLWESFEEWSAYGAGVPLLLDESETVIQYYVPFLSGIQLYIDPSKPSPKLRRPDEESDVDSSRETSSDGGSDYAAERTHTSGFRTSMRDANIQSLNRLSLRNQISNSSSSDESEISNPPGQLVFEYMEHASPFTRQPLANQISALASHFPKLKTFRSCDLSSSSWVSVAWYPIYRIPMGPTLQNLDACFLTFHSLSTSSSQNHNAEGMHHRGSGTGDVRFGDVPFKLPLPTFGLASHKFKVAFWNPNGVYECQKANSLFRAAENWLRLLRVNHPDYSFFVSHNAKGR